MNPNRQESPSQDSPASEGEYTQAPVGVAHWRLPGLGRERTPKDKGQKARRILVVQHNRKVSWLVTFPCLKGLPKYILPHFSAAFDFEIPQLYQRTIRSFFFSESGGPNSRCWEVQASPWWNDAFVVLKGEEGWTSSCLPLPMLLIARCQSLSKLLGYFFKMRKRGSRGTRHAKHRH